MNNILEHILSRKNTVILIFVVAIIMGIASYLKIPKELQPSIQIPVILVSAAQKGISPEDNINLIVKPLEKYLYNVKGLKKMTSYASIGKGTIHLEFFPDHNLDQSNY